MYCLIFFSDFIVDVLMFKKKKFWILPHSEKSLWDSGTQRVWVYREKNNIDVLAQIFFMASIHVWKPGKNFGPKSQC